MTLTPPSPSRKPVHVVFAAAMLQPLIGDNNAYNWLADMRRRNSGFILNDRITSFPEVSHDRGQMYYYDDEIMRMMDELILST
jgi:hypothetical protein